MSSLNLDLEILKEILLWQFQTKGDDKVHNGWTHTEFKPPTIKISKKQIGS